MSAEILVRSVRGLEWVVADEVAARLPAAEAVTLAAREVGFRLPEPGTEVLGLRTVDDAFLVVGTVPEVGPARTAPPDAARRIARLDWAGALDHLSRLRAVTPLRASPAGPRFDVVASLTGRHNYNRFAVENAVGAALVPVLGGEYLPRTADGRPAGQPELTVRVFVRGGGASVALRLADRPLHRRPYKVDTGTGTLHPPVAAALARLADPAPGATVADPFCGDGTVAIETALSYPDSQVTGSDIDPVRLANAARNCERAGVDIPLRQQDAGRFDTGGLDAVLTNPPWSVAVQAGGLLGGSLDPFWRRLPGLLTPAGRLCLLADLELDAPGRLRRHGYRIALATQARLAGRVIQIVLSGPPGRPELPGRPEPPELPERLAGWHRAAIAAGVVTGAGF
ncbi:MAG: methyltransferase [Micromonosporaceae bacterium]|nr:methyltransferase [Micromonosporaceae bacterium]